ncbi:hypothetical protein [Streptomyces umbrinus]|uniref:hypothetical protein n=1 Tax=Streptomyces umbrinus TaxID=67370 RepID=UPI0033CF2F26
MKAMLIKRGAVAAVLIAAGILPMQATAQAATSNDAMPHADAIAATAETANPADTETGTPREPAETSDVGVAGALVTVSPSAEVTDDPLNIGRVAWTQRCPRYRFCTTQQGSSGSNLGFQFYRCTEYALTNWGVNGDPHALVYNNQNVTVKYLDRRHAELNSTPPGSFEIIDFKPVWYISLCN